VPRSKPPYVKVFTDNRGKRRCYYRRKGFAEVPLPLPEAPGFWEAYSAAANNKGPAGKTRAPTAGTLGSLIVAYLGSPAFTRLRPATQGPYRRILDRLRREAGDDAVSDFQRRHLEVMVDRREAEGGPEAGNNLRRMLKLLFKLALKRNMRADDPTVGIDKRKAAKPAGKEMGWRTWSEGNIDAFIAKYPLGTREYLALSLLLYTGQRRGDAVKLGPKNIKGKYDPKNFKERKLSFVQEKTGTPLTIPIHAKLVEALAQANIPADAPAFLLTHRGKPFTPEGFGNYFSECADHAGIKEQASAHGLRKAAATRLADAGCTPHEVMAITGHVSLSEVQRYTKAVQQERLADQAMSKLL
jgi:site-specific recombinase XerD